MSEELPTKPVIPAYQVTESVPALFSMGSVLLPIIVVVFTAIVACGIGFKYGEVRGVETGRMTEKCAAQGGVYNDGTAVCVKFVALKGVDGGAP